MASRRNLEARARIRRHHPTALARLALSDQAVGAAVAAEDLVHTVNDGQGGPLYWLDRAVLALREAEELVTRAVIYERARGTTWEQIGEQFRITKQSAQARYNDDVARWEAGLHAPFGADDNGDGKPNTRLTVPNITYNYRPDDDGPHLDGWARDRCVFPHNGYVERPVTGNLPELTVSQELGMIAAEEAWRAKNTSALAGDYAYLADLHEWKAGVYERQAATATGQHRLGILGAAAAARALAQQYRAQGAEAAPSTGA